MSSLTIDPVRGGYTPTAAQMVNDLPEADRERVIERLQVHRRRGVTVQVVHVVNAIYKIRDGGNE